MYVYTTCVSYMWNKWTWKSLLDLEYHKCEVGKKRKRNKLFLISSVLLINILKLRFLIWRMRIFYTLQRPWGPCGPQLEFQRLLGNMKHIYLIYLAFVYVTFSLWLAFVNQRKNSIIYFDIRIIKYVVFLAPGAIWTPSSIIKVDMN